MQNINVNIVPDSYPQTIRYSQGDVGREFKINVVGFTIPTGATVKIQATKPSGFGFSVAGTVSGNAVSFTTTAIMTDEAGRFPAELEITKDSVVIGTANFIMWGEANPHPEGTTDGQQGTIIPELTLLVERVEAAASSVLDMQVVAETLAAGSQASYSYDEDTNTATFGIPQGEAGAGAAGVVASAYSSSKTYKVGDYVLHNSNLYRCTTAITTAEAFTAAHWTQIVLADDVSDLKTDLQSIYIDTVIEIGMNRFVYNGHLITAENAERASMPPIRVPRCGKIIVNPEKGYTLAVMGAIGATWSDVETGFTTPKVVDISSYDFFAIQVIKAGVISQDAIPFRLLYIVEDEIPSAKDILDEIYPFDLGIEIGVNRYLSSEGGSLVTGSSTSRASCPPFYPKYPKFKIKLVSPGFFYKVYKSTDGVAWYTVTPDWVYQDGEYEFANGTKIFLQFGYNNDIPSDTNIAEAFYLGLIDDYEQIRPLSSLKQNANKSSLWEIGSLGSNGEDYDVRNYEIRTRPLLPINQVISFELDASLSTRFCFYDENGNFISRTSAVPLEITNEYIRKRWTNACYVRYSIWTSETPVADVSNYSLTKIYTVNGSPLESQAVELHATKKAEASVFKLKKTSAEAYGECDAKFLFITDIHNEQNRVARTVALANAWGTDYISAVVNGGDTVQLTGNESLAWYNSLVNGLKMPILNTVGNHDAWNSLQGDLMSASAVYNLVIAPIASKSAITQPTGAASNGYNYYYKDFNNKVRVIVLDCMYWDSTQKTWFESVLDSAKTSGLHVLCVTHASFPWDEMTWIDTLWSKAGFPDGYYIGAALADSVRTNIEAAQAVQAFIDGGGKFIAWFTGHQHGDDLHKLQNYGNQLVITMASLVQRASQLQKSNDESNYNYDCMTYIAIDATNEVIKLLRIGADIDLYGVKHEGLCLKYSDNSVVASW